MEIKLVDKSDFEMAVEVYTDSWRASHRHICTPEFLESRDYAGYLRKCMNGLYLIVDQVPVGVFFLSGEEFSDLYIHPSHQGKGHGLACVAFAISQSGSLRLTVLSSNIAAIRLYEKMGFRFTGQDIALRDGLWEREMRYTEKNNG